MKTVLVILVGLGLGLKVSGLAMKVWRVEGFRL